MASSWIEHVKAYAKKNNMKYNEALKKAGPSYKKKGASARGSASKTTKKGNARKGKMPGSRLAYDDTKQEKEKKKK